MRRAKCLIVVVVFCSMIGSGCKGTGGSNLFRQHGMIEPSPTEQNFSPAGKTGTETFDNPGDALSGVSAGPPPQGLVPTSWSPAEKLSAAGSVDGSTGEIVPTAATEPPMAAPPTARSAPPASPATLAGTPSRPPGTATPTLANCVPGAKTADGLPAGGVNGPVTWDTILPDPNTRNTPTVKGERLALNPSETGVDRAVELSLRIDQLKAENFALQAKIVTLEQNATAREQVIAENLREVELATVEVIRTRNELKEQKKAVVALKQQIQQIEREEIETLKAIITALEKLLEEPGEQ